LVADSSETTALAGAAQRLVAWGIGLFSEVTGPVEEGSLGEIQQGWREAFLISSSYGMGDPMAPSEREGNSEGGGSARRFASREAKRAGITRP
jgi:hypothetical protein